MISFIRNKIRLQKKRVNNFLFVQRHTRQNINFIFKDKKIALIGPAETALNTGNGSYIDSFDLVIRVNKGPRLAADKSLQIDIGSKTDLLIHSLRYIDESDFILFKEQGLKFLVTYGRSGKWAVVNDRIFKIYNKLNLKKYNFKFYILSEDNYEEINNKYGISKPTAGFIILNCLINSGLKELYIAGFTFFRTEYINNYHDSGVTIENQKKRFEEQDSHNPDLEFLSFKEMIKDDHRIKLDDFLHNLVNG